MVWLAVACSGTPVLPARAEPPSGMDRPTGDVYAALSRLLDCGTWSDTEKVWGCSVLRMRGSVSVFREPSDGTVGTVRLNALITAHPRRQPGAEARSRALAAKIALTVLPEWKDGARWLAKAIAAARRDDRDQITRVGPINVVVRGYEPVDLPSRYVEIILTKRAVDDWLYPEDLKD